MSLDTEIAIYELQDLDGMRRTCNLAKSVLDYVESYVKEGVTTDELNGLCHDFMIASGATPATLNYNGYPKSVCTSVNHVVCHGIPSSYKLTSGDIINIDVTTNLDGWFGDTSRTFIVGECTHLAKRLVTSAKDALHVGIEAVRPYGHFGDIGRAIQKFINGQGFSIVRDYCGHGIGREFHAPPSILHYDTGNTGQQILPGMVFTIEPMINAGAFKTKLLRDGWTVITADRSLSAQFEHTLLVLENSVEILTL
jgi:methionyl aminopeptidase